MSRNGSHRKLIGFGCPGGVVVRSAGGGVAHHFAAQKLLEVGQRRVRDNAGQQEFPELMQPREGVTGDVPDPAVAGYRGRDQPRPGYGAHDRRAEHVGVDVAPKVAFLGRAARLLGRLQH